MKVLSIDPGSINAGFAVLEKRGRKVVELVVVDSAPTARLREIDGEAPRLPSVESNLSDFTATAEGVLERINALPIEEVMQQAISLMEAFEQLARNEDLQRVPGSAVALLDDTRALVGNEAIQAIPSQIEAAVNDLTALVAEIREGGAVESLNSALAQLDEAMAGINTASQSAPALAENLAKLTEEDIPAVLAELQGVGNGGGEPKRAQTTCATLSSWARTTCRSTRSASPRRSSGQAKIGSWSTTSNRSTI